MVRFVQQTGRKAPRPSKPIPLPSWSTSPPLPMDTAMLRPMVRARSAHASNKCHATSHLKVLMAWPTISISPHLLFKLYNHAYTFPIYRLTKGIDPYTVSIFRLILKQKYLIIKSLWLNMPHRFKKMNMNIKYNPKYGKLRIVTNFELSKQFDQWNKYSRQADWRGGYMRKIRHKAMKNRLSSYVKMKELRRNCQRREKILKSR